MNMSPLMTLFLLLLTVAPGNSRLACYQQARPIRRVAIVGAGIAGLSVAHALEPLDCQVFDSRSSLDTQAGAGIQLNGGLAVLGQIDPDVQAAVWQAGLPQRAIQSRCKSWSGDASQKAFDTLLQLDLKQTVQSAGQDVAQALLLENEPGDKQLLWTSIMRGALQKALLDKLDSNKIQFGKRLTQINPINDGVMCEFSDGSTAGPFDLVVGCDGIKSAVKEFVNTGKNKKATTKDNTDAIYSGLRIRYAVSDGNVQDPPQESSTLTQYFGDGAYALHGIYGAGPNQPNTQCAFIVYLDDSYIGPFRIKDPQQRQDEVTIGENADWSQDVRQTLNVARQSMLDQLESCSIPDQDDVLGSVIRRADRFFELGSYFHNPFSQWSRQVQDSGATVVLCGDAAHALPPFLGQGSNQAIQDAYCLAEKIFEYNEKVKNDADDVSLKTLLDDYQRIRWPATFGIFWKSVLLGYLETGGSNGIYSKFRDTLFKTLGIIGVAQRVLLNAAKPKIE